MKVQRPDMLRSCSLDFFLMRCYSQFVEEVKELTARIGLAAPRKRFDVQVGRHVCVCALRCYRVPWTIRPPTSSICASVYLCMYP